MKEFPDEKQGLQVFVQIVRRRMEMTNRKAQSFDFMYPKRKLFYLRQRNLVEGWQCSYVE